MRKILLLCSVLLWIAGCSYITGGESVSPDIIELADIQGCYYDSNVSSSFYVAYHHEDFGSERVEVNDSLYQWVYCRKVCIDSTNATDLTYERRIYWTLDTLQRLSSFFADSSLGKGSASVISYDENDGHFYKNLYMKIKYPDYSSNEAHRYIFEERDGIKYIYHHGSVILSSVEDDACAE